jgi:hypothetical protein
LQAEGGAVKAVHLVKPFAPDSSSVQPTQPHPLQHPEKNMFLKQVPQLKQLKQFIQYQSVLHVVVM